MAEKETKKEEVEEVAAQGEESLTAVTARVIGDAMERAMKAVVPPDMQERMKQLEEEHEEPYRLHPDKVAVLDISTSAESRVDGIPPYYDVPTGSEMARKVAEKMGVPPGPAEFTRQGLRITDRYVIVINHVAVPHHIYEFTVRDIQDWIDYCKNKPGMGQINEHQLAVMMRRAGGAT